MKALMLCDLPPSLFERGEDEAWREHFLPTPVLNLLEGFVRATEVEPFVLSFSRARAARGTLWGRVQVAVCKVPLGTGLSSLYLPRVLRVRRAVRAIEPDIVHGQGVESGYAWLATLQPRPSVVTLHGVLGLTAQLAAQGLWPRILHELQGATLRRARHVIAISDFVATWLEEVSSASVYRVPNAVHRAFFDVVRAPAPTFDLLYVGRICPEKGLLDAVEALGRLEARGMARTLAVVGRPSGSVAYLERCRVRASQLRRSSVRFLGALPSSALPKLMRHSGALVLPSAQESFSMAAAEASAAGLPVIAYRVGGVPSVVAHGETGVLVEPGAVEELADAIARVTSDAALRERLGDAAKVRACSWHQDEVARRTADVYARVLTEGAQRRAGRATPGRAPEPSDHTRHGRGVRG